MSIGFIKAGIKILYRRYFLKNNRFKGTPAEICQQIIEKTWNGQYYQTGLGHFDYFWIRDFGIVIKPLIKSGNASRVKKTVDWALSRYIKAGKVSLCIDSSDNVFDAPKKSIDALPWLLFSIFEAKYILNRAQKQFLELEIKKYCESYIDPKTGDIRDGISYSELRDAVYYEKSSYAILMVYILSKNSKNLNLKGFRHKPNVYLNILNSYWNGHYYKSDINNDAFSAESNLLPFELGVVKDKDKLLSIFDYISTNKINRPFPMKYTDTHNKFVYHWWGKFIMPNYAGSTVWTWMGVIYLRLLKSQSSNEFVKQRDLFDKVILKYKNFPELLKPNGEWYKTTLYKADEGMVWAALYLDIAN